MNRERLNTLRTLFEDLPDERVDMRFWMTDLAADKPHESLLAGRPDFTQIKHDCGTAGCIAGWTLSMWPPRAKSFEGTYQQVFDLAQKRLGLTDDQAVELFTPDGYQIPGVFTRDRAIGAIDSLLETGEVQW